MADAHAKHHDYHLVDPSPWPAVGSVSAFILAVGAISWMHHMYAAAPLVFGVGVIGVLYTFVAWWRDVIREAQYDGFHTRVVQISHRYGMILFIASEVMFFVAWFWAYFNTALFPGEAHEVGRLAVTGGVWPPKGIETFDPWHLPLLNTLILLTSGTTVTWAHHALALIVKDMVVLVCVETEIQVHPRDAKLRDLARAAIESDEVTVESVMMIEAITRVTNRGRMMIDGDGRVGSELRAAGDREARRRARSELHAGRLAAVEDDVPLSRGARRDDAVVNLGLMTDETISAARTGEQRNTAEYRPRRTRCRVKPARGEVESADTKRRPPPIRFFQSAVGARGRAVGPGRSVGGELRMSMSSRRQGLSALLVIINVLGTSISLESKKRMDG